MRQPSSATSQISILKPMDSKGLLVKNSSDVFTGSMDNSGWWTLGPQGGQSGFWDTHNINGQMFIRTNEYSGGATRTAAVSVSSGSYFCGWVDHYTNLTTSAWAVRNGVQITTANGFFIVDIRTTAGHHGQFSLSSGIVSGSAYAYSVSNQVNCSASAAGGNITISGIGDGRTYTLAINTGSGAATFKADAATTGTTQLRFIGFWSP